MGSWRWAVAHLMLLVLIIVLVSLGLWQLRRLEERQVGNQVGLSRYTAEPLDLEAMVAGAGSDLDTLEDRRATTRGEWDPTYEVYVRSQVRDGRSGLWVVTPLILADGKAVMVNRGWIPVELDRQAAVPPQGGVEVSGTVRASRSRSSIGPTDRPGIEDTIARVDLSVLDGYVPHSLLGVYLEESTVNPGPWPLRLDEPVFDDEGSHLVYAVQWFSFALVALVGYAALIRSKAHRRHRPAESAGEVDSL
ncbi:MAG: SURF1 family protein [bacterium]|nr:SURF1 family protein [Acidimicrobiia bacterium]MCY4650078.1 SURF1 family protein [bacterium]